MLRNRAVALFLTCTASTLAFALGLGPLKSDSSLNEPFSGRIDILGAAPEDFDTLTVSLADAAQFQRAGVERNPVLFGLRFSVDDSVPGQDFIRVTSKEPIREPYLNFLVELNWASGRLVREYTVLLDPPLYDPSRRRSITAVAPAPAAPAPAAPASVAPSTGSPAAATPAAPPPAMPAAAGPSGYEPGRELAPVAANDTLWSIASRTRPRDGTTVQQMMLALLRTNPAAFGQDNVNLVRRGAVLRLPSEAELNRLSAREAYAEIQRHNQLWQNYRDQVAATPTTQPVGAAAPSSPFDLEEPADDSARLELVAPGAAEGGGAPGTAGTGGGDELLREEVEARAQQAAELESKLVEAEGIIDLLQRQVNIKDEELAALQARLAELGVEAPAGTFAEDDAALAAETDEALAGLDEDLFETATVDADETAEEAVDETAEETADDMTVAATPAAEVPATEAPAAAETPAAAPARPAGPAPAAPPPRVFPTNLVPESIAARVPGGSFTVLGAAVLLVLGILIGIVTSLMRRRAGAGETAAAAAVPASATTLPPTAAEPDSEAPTELGVGGELETQPAFDPNATVEAEADADAADALSRTQIDVAQPEAEDDPLEEVNVYLAYERFDQAEELVKRVIEEHPERHEYKLRLLEVYYSSNDRAAYENAARDLRDAVGEADPLWASALAMWAEMSPERALFEEGGVETTAPAPESGAAFVDITA
ncbi:MAG: FimV/HubP family polar landmark protein, partial [Gammaproteobacteria bacterium]